MENLGDLELEMIRYEKIRHVHIFLNSILFRNMHEHGAFEADVLLRGAARIRGDDREFHVRPGTILLFNPYEPHEITAETTEPVQVLSIQISNHFCKSYFPSLPNIEFNAREINDLLPRESLQTIRGLIFSTAMTFFQARPFFELDCVGQTILLLVNLLRSVPYTLIPEAQYSIRKNKMARIRRIVNYIDQHYKERITLASLAEMEGITTTHLSHFFRDAFHLSFQEYLNSVRLEKALILMKDPDLYMIDICMECGFSDNRYLNRMFLKEFGCTAAEYRQKCIVPGLGSDPLDTPASYPEFRHSPQDSLTILRRYLETANDKKVIIPGVL